MPSADFAVPGTKSGPLSSLLRQLRLKWDDFSLVPKKGRPSSSPGKKLRFNNEFSLLEQEVREQFPRQADNFRRLAQVVDEHDERNLNYRPRRTRPIIEEIVTDPLLIDMIYCPLMFYGRRDSPRYGLESVRGDV